MGRRSGVVVAVAVTGMAALVAGCGSDGAGDEGGAPATTTVVAVSTVVVTSPPPVPATTTGKVRPAPSTTVKVRPAPPPAPAPAPPVATPASNPKNVALKKYFKENFGGAFGPEYKVSWYDNIKAIVGPDEFGAVTIKTNIYPDSDATEPAGAMCLAIMLSDIKGVTSGEILGAGGARLDSCP